MCADLYQGQKPCSRLSLTALIGHRSPDSPRSGCPSHPTYCFLPVRSGWLPQPPGTSCVRSCAHCLFPPNLHQPALGICEMLRGGEMVICLTFLTCTWPAFKMSAWLTSVAMGLDVVGTCWHCHLHSSRGCHHSVVVVIMETDARMLCWRKNSAGNHFGSFLNLVQQSPSTWTSEANIAWNKTGHTPARLPVVNISWIEWMILNVCVLLDSFLPGLYPNPCMPDLSDSEPIPVNKNNLHTIACRYF